MDFSYYLNPQTPGPETDGKLIDEVLGQVDLAEKYGFTQVWLTEHHFTGYNVYSDPLIMAAAISQRNPSMTIGFAVNVVPFLHPVRFATQINLLDQLTKGKLIAGIGPGNGPIEFSGFGVDVQKRHEMMTEFVNVLEQAWNSEETGGFEYSGEYFQGNVSGRIIPSSIQKPMRVAVASATPERLEWIGSKGWSLLLGPQHPEILAARMSHYFEGMEKAGLTPEQRARAWANTSVLRQVYVSEDDEDWRETLSDVIDTYVRKSALANTGIDDLPKDQFETRKQGYLDGGWLHGGSADEIFERLRPFAEMGINNIMCWMNFGHMPDERIRAGMKRFAEQVIPRLNEVKVKPDILPELLKLNPERLHASQAPSRYQQVR